MSKHRIVIVGGGFGGVRAALSLAEDHRFHITLISDHPDFRYYPALFRTASGGKQNISSIPLKELFEHKPVQIIQDKVTSIEREQRNIKTQSGSTFPYDGAILALGVQTNYFGIKGLEEYSYGIKNVAEAERLKQHLHKQLVESKEPDLNYVVIGGGPTGVELAGVLPSYLKAICKRHGIKHPSIHVDLVEAAPRLLPRMPKDISRSVAKQLRKVGVRLYLSTAVQAQTADALMINSKRILSHTVIWTAGVSNSPFFTDQQFQLARNKRVRVDQYLQTEPGLYVIGDNADTPYSGMAQTALYDGKFVANNLIRLADKKEPKPYIAKGPVYAFPAGPHWAAVLWRKARIRGRLGYTIRSFADLIAYHDYEPIYHATERWLGQQDSEESCPLCNDL